jgi:hypothetical protein
MDAFMNQPVVISEPNYAAPILIRERISQGIFRNSSLGKNHPPNTHNIRNLKMSTLSFTMLRHMNDRYYYTGRLNRDETSIGLDSAVPRSPPHRVSSMPVGLDGATRLSRPSHRRHVSPIGLDNAAVSSSPKPHLRPAAEPIGLAAAVRRHNIGQRPFGPYVCKEWEKCWFCTEYVEAPRHEPVKSERERREASQRERSVQKRREASAKREKVLREQRGAAEAVMKQEAAKAAKKKINRERAKESWIERKMRDFKNLCREY